MPLCRPEDTLEQCARRWRRALRRREKEARDLLLQQYGEVYRWMRGELKTLLQEIQEQQGEVSPWHLVRAQRYKALLAQIEAEMKRLGGVAARETENAQYDALQMAWESAGEQLQAAGLEVSFFGFPHEAFQEMVGLLADGTPLAEHFARTVTPEAMQQLRRALLAGLAAGWSPARVARYAAQKGVGLSLARAMTIARTEMLRAYREGTRRRYAEAGVREWIWLSSRDRRTCPACLALHGRKFSVDEPQRGHPNCRCTMVPAIPGVDYGIESGETWLRRQPPDIQDAILGRAGGEAYRAGEISLEDFVAFRRDRLGGMYYAKSLRQILGPRARWWGRRVRSDIAELAPWREHAHELKKTLQERFSLRSTWNGKLLFRDLGKAAVGVKEWDCSIGLSREMWKRMNEDWRRHVLLHEMLHSLSPGLNPRVYTRYRGWEEGVVETLTYRLYPEIYGKHSSFPSGYERFMKALETIRTALGMDAKEFYEVVFRAHLGEREGLVFSWGENKFGQQWYTMVENLPFGVLRGEP